MKINCIIIEDEPLARERLRIFIGRLTYLNLLAEFENGADALSFISAHTVEIIFLDIHMDELSGIQLLESTKMSGQVILTTAYQEYALKGFDLKVTDYLLKPFTFERFIQAVEKARQTMALKTPEPEKNYIFIKTEYRLEKIFLNDILYIEGMRDYRRIHTGDKRIMTLQTFKDLETEIPMHLICRVHKSFMVAINKINSIERDRIRIKDVLIPISETYKKTFMELVGKFK